jgi:RNA polymerase primary sigma factor
MSMSDNDPVKMYERELATIQPLTSEEESRLFLQAEQSGEQGEDAKRRLIESKLHLVLPIAQRYLSRGLSMLELIQEGNLGLFRAIDEFPKTHLRDFPAFAAVCIEDAISTALASRGRVNA